MNRTMRIVVADDEPAMRKYLEYIVKGLGHELVAAAENGRDLVQLCTHTQPDMVISDVAMPEMDGIHALLELNKKRQIPVVFITAQHTFEGLDRLPPGQVLRCMTKPISRSDLEQVIERFTLDRTKQSS